MKRPSSLLQTNSLLAMLTVMVMISGAFAAPPAPTDVVAEDLPADGGGAAVVTWTIPEGVDGLEGFQVWRTETVSESTSRVGNERGAALLAIQNQAYANEYQRLVDVEGVAPEDASMQARAVARQAVIDQRTSVTPTETGPHGRFWVLVDTVSDDTDHLEVGKLSPSDEYRFMVYTVAKTSDGGVEKSAASAESGMVLPVASGIDVKRLPLFFILALLCGAVLFFIHWARSGRPITIRKIAGLSAVYEAVGRATEMGRPILYVPGIQDMDDLQTVAGITVLGRVAKTAAEYDARIEVPTSRSLVMSAARETVHSSYLAAGRTDAYNPDLIYYVTDEQFGYTAYASGLIVREKPAACFYMGCFFAESLILAETGNSVGAIQIAGTAMPSQLPFFVAACDYTLIGEEFFAASAYLSGQPDQLGSLKGQDMGKIIVGAVLIVGCLIATAAVVTGSESLMHAVDWFKGSVLSA
ncbi:MAG: hypothetical protein P8J59_02985 [Phycisphaerales bacterium]|nr:hypothetical protein [Phycisphaerales bacterium]